MMIILLIIIVSIVEPLLIVHGNGENWEDPQNCTFGELVINDTTSADSGGR